MGDLFGDSGAPTTEEWARKLADFGSTARPYPYCTGTVDYFAPMGDEGTDLAKGWAPINIQDKLKESF